VLELNEWRRNDHERGTTPEAACGAV